LGVVDSHLTFISLINVFTQVREDSHQQCHCKKILHWASVCFSAHTISQPCIHTTS